MIDHTDYLQSLLDNGQPIPNGRWFTTRPLVVPGNLARLVERPARRALQDNVDDLLGREVDEQRSVAASAGIDEPGVLASHDDGAFGVVRQGEDRTGSTIGLGNDPQLESHEGLSKGAPGRAAGGVHRERPGADLMIARLTPGKSPIRSGR